MRYSDAGDDGVTQALVCSLDKPHEAPDLTEAERIASPYADLLSINHLSIDYALYARLARHFSEKEVVELGSWRAICIGFGRLSASRNMVEDLPDRFQAQGDTPVPSWGSDAWLTQATAKAC